MLPRLLARILDSVVIVRGRPIVKYVMFYEAEDNFRSKAPAHVPAHRARLDDFHARGMLLMAGQLGDPMQGAALGIFTTREAAEEFAAGDPFVLSGVVRNWSIREWHEVLARP
jgi:uncharacterized protein YciI